MQRLPGQFLTLWPLRCQLTHAGAPSSPPAALCFLLRSCAIYSAFAHPSAQTKGAISQHVNFLNKRLSADHTPCFLVIVYTCRPRDGAQKCQLADPDSSAELTAQLSALGLRLHNTLGDGNCLFRALSDQLYGTESHHLKLRAEITAWMAKYAERYEGFVEDDRSFEDHLRCMREPGQFAFLVGLASYGMIRFPRRALCARIDRQPS